MHPAVLLLGGGLAAALWLASRKREPTDMVMRAGQWYAVTLDLGEADEDTVATEIGAAGGVIDLDSPDGTLRFEMRPGVDLPVSVPGALPFPGFDDIIITEITEIDR